MSAIRRVIRFLLGKDGPRGPCHSDECPMCWIMHDRQAHAVMGFRLEDDA